MVTRHRLSCALWLQREDGEPRNAPRLYCKGLPAGTMAALRSYLEQQVLAVTQDGRVIVGTLRGVDNVGSVIMSGCVERIYSTDAGVEEVPLGLYIVRGDAISLIGDIDIETDKQQDLSQIRAEPIPETRHF